MNFIRNYTLLFICDNNKRIFFSFSFLIKNSRRLMLFFFFCFLSENNKQRHINDLILTCQCWKIFSSRNYETIMIVLLSMRIVAADQRPCLSMCVIRHGFSFFSHLVVSNKSWFWFQRTRYTEEGKKLR